MSYKNNTQVDVLPGVDLCKNRRKDIFLLALQHRLLVIFISDSLYTMSSEPTRLLKLSKPLLNSDFVLAGNYPRGSRETDMSRTHHGAFSSSFSRRILCRGYITWWILGRGTSEAPLDGLLTRVPMEQLQCSCSRYTPVPFSRNVIGLLSQPVLLHTPPLQFNSESTMLTQRGVGSRPTGGLD